MVPRPVRPHLSSLWLVLLASCAGPDAPESAGRLVIVGGALRADNDEVYTAILEGREGTGPLCVFPTASGSPAESMASAVERFAERIGPESVEGISLTVDEPERANDPEVRARIESCSGFFFVGGSQSRISDVFRPGGASTPAFDALVARWREGAVVSGTSAGAAIMTDPMIAGGDSEEALLHGVATTDDADGVGVVPGLGFFDVGFVDQHFLARGRWGRLIIATLRHPAFDVGFGIDENTALVVDGDEAWVAGASGVVVVDARAARNVDGRTEGVRLWLAGSGDRVALETLEVEPAEEKSALPTGGPVGEPGDPFGRWVLLHVIEDLAGTAAPSVAFEAAEHRLELAKEPSFTAASFPEEGVQGAPRGLSAGPFALSLEPIDR